jgi:hypothetical protein
MGSVLFKVSDLTGEIVQPEQEDQLTALVVEQHPDFEEAITLEVLPEDIEGQLPEPTELVLISYNSEQYLLPVEQFNSLFRHGPATDVLARADAAQQEERSRGRRGRRRGDQGGRRERKPRVDYTSPEHAGEPHRGTISEAERIYVQEHLDEVNVRLREQGLREIDPTDLTMIERYGFQQPEL